MDQIKAGERVLLMPGADGAAITDDNMQTVRQSLGQGIELVTSPGEGSENFDAVLWNVHSGPSGTQKVPEATQGLVLKALKPDGKLIIRKSGTEDCSTADLISQLKLNGFVSISEDKDFVIAKKPNYAIGSSVKLNIAGKSADAKKVWSLADADEDDNADMIDTDDLLQEEDKQRPDPESLKVCGTTKKRKACANCTCGLAQELEDEAKANVAANQTKSSCGNCYLGDAFRCASCPYLGMPAFKPGEKILLDNTSDI